VAPRRQTGLKSLASELGVSVTTVSRALAGYNDVSAETRARVKAAAHEHGYVPSRVGRMLVSGRTDFIGMVLPIRAGHLIDAFLGEFVAGLSSGLANDGRDLFLATATGEQTELEVMRHIVDGDRADAIVLNRTELEDARVEFLTRRRFPFVSHGRVLTGTVPEVWFDTDGEAAFGEAAERLVALGHTHFGLLTIAEPFTFAHLRRRGLEGALAAAGLTLRPDCVVEAPMSDRDSARAAARRLLTMKERPTAILGITDAQALAVLEVTAELSISVPEEISVIGFDDVPIAAYASPALSTFDQHARESASIVAGMVIGILKRGPTDIRSRLIRPQFVARGSHGPAPRERTVRRRRRLGTASTTKGRKQ
jgi:LacI family transcriptional regulator